MHATMRYAHARAQKKEGGRGTPPSGPMGHARSYALGRGRLGRVSLRLEAESLHVLHMQLLELKLIQLVLRVVGVLGRRPRRPEAVIVLATTALDWQAIAATASRDREESG